jgi:hypothetical protein
MSLEVVAEFASREYHCVEQLLDWWKRALVSDKTSLM